MAELSYRDFLDVFYNPKRRAEKATLFRRWGYDTLFSGMFAKTDQLFGDTNARIQTYGAAQSDWMNTESNVFSLLPKEPWGPRSGMRYIDVTASRASGIQETGNLKAATLSSYGIIRWGIKLHNTMFAASFKSLWSGNIDDSLDRWQNEQDRQGKLLARSIDEFLTRPIYGRQDYAGSGTGGATAVAQATYVIETIDRMVSSSSEATWIYSAGGLSGATSADLYPYDQRLRRSGFSGAGYGNGPYDAVVDTAVTARSLQLSMIDDALVEVELNGATRDGLILLTGPDTANVINQKLEAKQVFNSTTRVVKTLNGVQRVSPTGVEAGFEVASYRGIPIFTARSLYLVKPPGGISTIYGLYLPDIAVKVALPTLYLETVNEDWVLLDKMRRKAGYFFGAELVFKRFMTHFKINNLTA